MPFSLPVMIDPVLSSVWFRGTWFSWSTGEFHFRLRLIWMDNRFEMRARLLTTWHVSEIVCSFIEVYELALPASNEPQSNFGP